MRHHLGLRGSLPHGRKTPSPHVFKAAWRLRKMAICAFGLVLTDKFDRIWMDLYGIVHVSVLVISNCSSEITKQQIV